MPRCATRELDSRPNSGFTLRATAFANGPGVHEANSPDSGVGHWRDDFYFYVGGCRFTEVATRRESGRAVQFGERTALLLSGRVYSGKEFSLVSYDLYKYLRDHTQGFSELAAFPSLELLFGVRRSGSSEAAQSYPGEFVSGNYFSMFGITAYAGRFLTNADDQPNAPPVAVMSYRLWQEKYGLDPSVIG